MDIEIKQLTSVTNQIVDDFNLLLAILSDNVPLLSIDSLLKIINSDNSYVFVAIANNRIVGMLTLIIYRIPTGCKAWIEDVVVDPKMQGKGLGKQLIEKAISHAKKLDIKSVDLTSRPFRVAANILYQKMGFIQRETNAYRLEL